MVEEKVEIKKAGCIHCKPKSKEPDIVQCRRGMLIIPLSRKKNEIVYNRSEFEEDGSAPIHYCLSCGRKLTEEEVYGIFGLKKKE
jgi:hypothetical protein